MGVSRCRLFLLWHRRRFQMLQQRRRSCTKLAARSHRPKVVTAVAPEHTTEAREHRLKGVSVIYLVVDEEGVPKDERVFRSLGEVVDPKYCAAAQGLDDKAIEAVKQYRFRPGLLKGHPVKVDTHVEVDFQLF